MTIIHYRVWSKDRIHTLACGLTEPHHIQHTTDLMTLTTCPDCLATWSSEDLNRQLKSDNEYWKKRALAAEKTIEDLQEKLLATEKEVIAIKYWCAGWERAAVGHRERWQARTQEFIQVRKERDQYFDLLVSIEKVIRP